MFNFHGEYFLIKQSKRTDRFHRKRTRQGHQFATLQRCGKSEEGVREVRHRCDSRIEYASRALSFPTDPFPYDLFRKYHRSRERE